MTPAPFIPNSRPEIDCRPGMDVTLCRMLAMAMAQLDVWPLAMAMVFLCLLFALFIEIFRDLRLWGHKGPPRDPELLSFPLKQPQASALLSLVGIPLAAGRLVPAGITDARVWSSGEHLSLPFKIHVHLRFLLELDLLLSRRSRCQRPPPKPYR